MKNYRIKAILVIIAVSMAGSAAATPAWVNDAAIDYVSVSPSGRVLVTLKKAVPDLGCTGNDFGVLEFDTAAANFEEQYSLILAAHMAGKTITVYVSACSYYPIVGNTRVH